MLASYVAAACSASNACSLRSISRHCARRGDTCVNVAWGRREGNPRRPVFIASAEIVTDADATGYSSLRIEIQSVSSTTSGLVKSVPLALASA